jgi:hypothetical protein
MGDQAVDQLAGVARGAKAADEDGVPVFDAETASATESAILLIMCCLLLT